MLIRDYTCAVCGAPRKTLDESVAVMCLHCGSIVAFGQSVAISAEAHAAGVQRLVKPSAAQARLTAVSTALLSERGDREKWRQLAEEQVLVMAILEVGAKLPADPQSRARHVKNAVALHELSTFDPVIVARLNAMTAPAMAITTGDPIAATRDFLAAARAYYIALAEHPDCPPGALREGADHLAREMVRQSISGYAPLLGDRALERIRVEVLGDRATTIRECPKCGGPLPAAAVLSSCPHCGAVTRIDEDDAWTTGQWRIWEIARADLVRRGNLDGPTPVITVLGGFIHTGARDIPAKKAAAFVRRAIAWLSAADLNHGLDVLGMALGAPEQRALLDGIRQELAEWAPDPAERPAAPVVPTHFPPPTEAEEAAWIESALALWNLRRSNSLVELLAQPLSAMQVAAMHQQPAGVSPRAAVAFFERAFPSFSRTEMGNEVSRMAGGYDHARVRAFLADLAALLC